MSDMLRDSTRPQEVVSPDAVLARVTGPGSPFEIGERDGLRQFVAAPPDLNLLIESARRYGDRTCVIDFDSAGVERRMSYDQVFAWRDELVPILHITRGDRVAIAMRNRAEWLVAFLAVMKAGGVAVLVNSRGSGPELLAMLEDVDPAVVLADSERAAAIRESGFKGRVLDLTRPFDAEELARRIAEPMPDPGVAKPTDPCAILFTSGTTGRVKGAVLSHRNVITGLMTTQMSGMVVLGNMAAQMGTTTEALIAQMPQQASLLVYPLFHISGLGSGFLSPFLGGGKVVIMRRWDAEEAARLIAAEQISMFSAVPTMLWDILHRARIEGTSLASLRNIGCGGQALPVNLVEEVHALCPHAQIGTGYGMTECSGAIAQAVGPEFMARPAAAGRRLSMVDVRIEGPDGEILPPARPARSSCAGRRSCPATGTAPRTPPPFSPPMAGCAPAMSGSSTTTTTSSSSTARRTWSFRAARTSTAPRSSACSARSPASPNAPPSACPTNALASASSRSSSLPTSTRPA
ncbi:AMP-binding protein [Novosphingobium sp. THN1]|uniref:class I adenylate-forming enzyme family protein n=1 Tax=Novosphingobium sp. THN1 TaxID=1016987 RepID=UPI0026C4E837